ncbi:AAA family ATPase [Rugamonas sp. A1-17]|nr:AAA family ATPase [Rugamonas sp. A1-17]
MALSNDEVYELASEAVRHMHDAHGDGYTFTFDEIWQNVPASYEILSTAKPHQSKRLIAGGWVEKTGEMRRAASKLRAGSSTPEYRFGPQLVRENTSASARIRRPSVRVADDNLASLHSSRAASKTSVSELIKLMNDSLDAEGYIISPAELANFFLAMTVSPLVILSGISGTGKSLLPRKFAEMTQSKFSPIPVQPQWSDNSDLFGYVPTLSQESYHPGGLISSLREARKNSDALVIALLDEMNLAPVEHYFSDFLSIAETRKRDSEGDIFTDELRIELPPEPVDGRPDTESDLRKMRLPTNLRIVGTANMDETTHSFSPKVLDRAFTIELDNPDLTVFASPADDSKSGSAMDMRELARAIVNRDNAISVVEAWPKSQEMFMQVAVMLQELQEIILPAGIKFGYRTRDAILLYLHFWREFDLEDVLTANGAMDYCLLQKILPKISGSGQVLDDTLQQLERWLKKDRSPAGSKKAATVGGNDFEEEDEDTDGTPEDFDASNPFTGPFVRCFEKVQRMRNLLEVDGATHYWGT